MGDEMVGLGWEPRRRPARGKAVAAGVLAGVLCLTVAGGAPAAGPSPSVVAGVSAIPAPPAGPSWAPAPVSAGGLRTTATAGAGAFLLHTAGGDVDFLPGVNLGGSLPGQSSVPAGQYRSWFAAMGRLGIRAVRVHTIHPSAFYRELAAHNRSHPTRPLYLVQGVRPPTDPFVDVFDPAATRAFQAELRDASAAVAGRLHRPADTWDADVTAWLAGWIIGTEFDGYATQASDKRNTAAPPATGRYLRSTADATPTERWLAARMDDLATSEAAAGRSAPVAFVNRPSTDPLRHPDEPVAADDLIGLDANHIRATAAWPGGTFASYHAYPYRPDFLRHEAGLTDTRYRGRADPYAGYLTALRRHHGDVPVLVTEFGVPSSLGSAHQGPLGRGQGDHSEQQAMRIDAELLRLIADVGLSGGLLCCWTDDWSASAPNTLGHADDSRRRLFSDALSSGQHAGLVAMDPAGPPGVTEQRLLDAPDGWPARRVTARIDEGYLRLRITLGDTTPGTLTVGLDVLPALTGEPAPASGDRRADAAFALDLVARAGQAYLRTELDPVPLDHPVPAAARGPQPAGWQRFQLVTDPVAQPAELQDTGVLRYGGWDPADPGADSRALWHRDGDDLVVRVPWAMAGFADPSAHRVALPEPVAGGVARLTLAPSPGVAVTVSAVGTDQQVGTVTWDDWQSVGYTARLKQGARALRDALVEVGAR